MATFMAGVTLGFELGLDARSVDTDSVEMEMETDEEFRARVPGMDNASE
jgi:hypothetical protein